MEGGGEEEERERRREGGTASDGRESRARASRRTRPRNKRTVDQPRPDGSGIGRLAGNMSTSSTQSGPSCMCHALGTYGAFVLHLSWWQKTLRSSGQLTSQVFTIPGRKLGEAFSLSLSPRRNSRRRKGRWCERLLRGSLGSHLDLHCPAVGGIGGERGRRGVERALGWVWAFPLAFCPKDGYEGGAAHLEGDLGQIRSVLLKLLG